eukprot:m.66667 g.66667  ORF g.66667 m.66667 type:complete len:345 (-) comp11822_c0_seq1:57-1091(-)
MWLYGPLTELPINLSDARDDIEADSLTCFSLASSMEQDQEYEKAISLYKQSLWKSLEAPPCPTLRINCVYRIARILFSTELESKEQETELPLWTELMEILGNLNIDQVADGDSSDYIPQDAQQVQDIVDQAQYTLGLAHAQGILLPEDPKKAMSWWIKAAREGKGNKDAMYSLGLLYSTPYRQELSNPLSEVDPDIKEARYWHEKSAEKGHAGAAAALGISSLYGKGCKKNQEEALKWLKIASEGGNLSGQGHLCYLFYKIKMYHKSVQWGSRLDHVSMADHLGLSHDEKQGLCLGLWVLGRCYEKGMVVETSQQHATELYTRVAKIDRDAAYALRKRQISGEL